MACDMSEFLSRQMQEALGPDNKWFCSQYHGYEVQCPERLLAYYIKHGGASHFRHRNATHNNAFAVASSAAE